MNRFVDLALSAVALLGASAAAAPQPQLQTAVLAGGCSVLM